MFEKYPLINALQRLRPGGKIVSYIGKEYTFEDLGINWIGNRACSHNALNITEKECEKKRSWKLINNPDTGVEMTDNYWRSYEFMTWEYNNEEAHIKHVDTLRELGWEVFGNPHTLVYAYQKPLTTYKDMHYKTVGTSCEFGVMVDNSTRIYERAVWEYDSVYVSNDHLKSQKRWGWRHYESSQNVAIHERHIRDLIHYKRGNREFKSGGASLW